MNSFHSSVRNWFLDRFESPTQPQADAWEALAAGENALVAAPTGSGKTLAAFLVAIDGLVKEAESGHLAQQVSVIYVSPLKALSNDIQRNLELPLREIQENLGVDGEYYVRLLNQGAIGVPGE